MVQEYVSPVRVHKYPFEMVMAAYERRFPSCPQIPVVLECVITEDSWTADDSQRYTTRRCQLNVDAPYLLKKMIGVDYVYFIQKNHLDLKSRVLEIEATNETFSARVGVVEKCRYYVHPENPEWTCFEQSALLDVKNFFGLESTVEKIAMKQYSANIAKGKELIESFMDEVLADGVRDLKPWEAGQHARNRELRRVVSRGTEPLSPLAAPDSQRHSQPGTSRRTPKPSTISMKQSSKNLNTRRSKSATKLNTMSSHELSHLRHRSKSPSHKKLEVLGTPGEQGVSKKDQHPTATRHRHSFDGANKKMSTLSIEKKRVTLSEPNLPVSGTQSIRKFREFKPCDCDLNRGAGFRMLLSPWNYLLVVVVFVVMLGLLLSMPLSLMYGNHPDRM